MKELIAEEAKLKLTDQHRSVWTFFHGSRVVQALNAFYERSRDMDGIDTGDGRAATSKLPLRRLLTGQALTFVARSTGYARGFIKRLVPNWNSVSDEVHTEESQIHVVIHHERTIPIEGSTEPGKDWGFWAEILEWPGCFAAGNDMEELLESLREGMYLYAGEEEQ